MEIEITEQNVVLSVRDGESALLNNESACRVSHEGTRFLNPFAFYIQQIFNTVWLKSFGLSPGWKHHAFIILNTIQRAKTLYFIFRLLNTVIGYAYNIGCVKGNRRSNGLTVQGVTKMYYIAYKNINNVMTGISIQ